MQLVRYKIGDRIKFSWKKWVPSPFPERGGSVEKEIRFGTIIDIGAMDNYNRIPYTLKLDDGSVIIVNKEGDL